MRFVKMHGAGNDFIVIDGTREIFVEEELRAVGKHVCDRNFGVGGDGLIVVLPSNEADFRMRVINSDGSEAEMCGNGIRVFAKYIYDRRMYAGETLAVETLAGTKIINLNVVDGKVHAARVDMGEPGLMRSEIPMASNGNGSERVVSEALNLKTANYSITCVSMGNPHCITYVDDVDGYPVTNIGPQIENHPSFPQRTNVEFIQVLNPRELKMRVWERGCGETMACGTGACASMVASILNEKVDGRSVTVHLRGGDLQIEWGSDNRVYMTGPAEEVFEGEIPVAVLKKWISEGV